MPGALDQATAAATPQDSSDMLDDSGKSGLNQAVGSAQDGTVSIQKDPVAHMTAAAQLDDAIAKMQAVQQQRVQQFQNSGMSTAEKLAYFGAMTQPGHGGLAGTLGYAGTVAAPFEANQQQQLMDAQDNLAKSYLSAAQIRAEREQLYNEKMQQLAEKQRADETNLIKQGLVRDPQTGQIKPASPDVIQAIQGVKDPATAALMGFGGPSVGPGATSQNLVLDSAAGQSTETPDGKTVNLPKVPLSQLTGEDLLNALPVGYSNHLRAVLDGKAGISPAYARSKAGQLFTNLAYQADPTFDMTDYNSRNKAHMDITSGPSSQKIKAINTALITLAAAKDASDQLGGPSDLGILNQPANYLRTEYKASENDPVLNTYNALSQAGADETNTAVNGANAALADRLSRENQVRASQSQEARNATFNAFIKELMGRTEPIQTMYQNAYKKPIGGYDLLSPEAKKAYLKITGERAPDTHVGDSPQPQSQTQQPSSYQEGMTATNPNTGAKLVFRGGKWTPM